MKLISKQCYACSLDNWQNSSKTLKH